MDDSLSRLAEAAGIEPRYWDIHGILHETTDETKRTLLAALGFAAGGDEAVGESLHALNETEWGRMTPPGACLRAGAPAAVAIAIPEGTSGFVRWRLELEPGATLSGEAAIADLTETARGEARGRGVLRRRLTLPALACGYHDLTVEAGGASGRTRLIVSPGRGYLPAEFDRRKLFGVSAQLYAMRTQGDWGIGDFSSLRQAVDGLAAHGADVLGLNPLHALFLDTPQDASPYCPSSRLFRNPLYIDVTAVPEFATSTPAQARLARLAPTLAAARTSESVDYPKVAKIKRAVLEILYREFCAGAKGARLQSFRRFVADGGADLTAFATFQALSEHFDTHDWSAWPIGCHDPNSTETGALAHRYATRIAFFEYLQWLCEEQMAAAAGAARARGMRIGLYNDLAVSVNTASADYWSHQDLFAGAARIGSPPDPFNEAGQEWGVIPMRPAGMRETAYAHSIALLRANMRHAGALRIDHVMGLTRLFLIPAGGKPGAGAYVRYPADEMFAIVALESARHRALVIGEDLGTVPEGFRERMAAAGMLSCKVFYFEREGDGFRRPEQYPPLAAASVSTHDLPTVRGYLEGTDIDSRATAGMYRSPEEEAGARAGRGWEKRQLFYALREAGLLPLGIDPENRDQGWTPQLARAIAVYVARAGSKLMLAQLDDLLGVTHQTNLPGSTWQHANWCRRHPTSLEEAFAAPSVTDTLGAIAAERAAG
jgi:4-alpha-glucanotransferase